MLLLKDEPLIVLLYSGGHYGAFDSLVVTCHLMVSSSTGTPYTCHSQLAGNTRVNLARNTLAGVHAHAAGTAGSRRLASPPFPLHQWSRHHHLVWCRSSCVW